MNERIDYILDNIVEYQNMHCISIEKLEDIKHYTDFHELLEVWIYCLNRKREILSLLMDCSYQLRQLIELIEEIKNNSRKKAIQLEKEMNSISNAIYSGKQLHERISILCNEYISCRPVHAEYKIEFDGIHIKIEANGMPVMWFDSHDAKKAEEFLLLVHQELNDENSIQDIGLELSNITNYAVYEMERTNNYLKGIMETYNLSSLELFDVYTDGKIIK